MTSRLPRIAVIDGDVASREQLASLLRARGWGVQVFGTIAAATYVLVPDPPDLMIVDVKLPDGLGLNLLEIVRRRTGEKVTTIAVSDIAEEHEVVRCFAAGAVDFISKPIREQEVIARCRVRLADGANLEPSSPDTPDVPTLEGLAFGRYRIVRELGRGGFGIVYLAEDGEAGRLVALKVSTPPVEDQQAQARFVRETWVLSKIKSDHVVRMLDTGVLHNRIYHAMEYVPGPSLSRRVAERGPLSEANVRVLARALLEALAATNAAGIVHRDVKPQNVILRNGEVERAVLLDFGLAKLHSDRTLTKTSAEILLGTPSYMPPEVVRGDAEHGHQGDLWALGVTLRYALEGEEAWPKLAGMNLLQTVASVGIPPPKSKVSAGFLALLTSLYAPRVVDRPSSAAYALQVLARVVAAEPPAPEADTRRNDATPKSPTPGLTSIKFHELRDTPKSPDAPV